MSKAIRQIGVHGAREWGRFDFRSDRNGTGPHHVQLAGAASCRGDRL